MCHKSWEWTSYEIGVDPAHIWLQCQRIMQTLQTSYGIDVPQIVGMGIVWNRCRSCTHVAAMAASHADPQNHADPAHIMQVEWNHRSWDIRILQPQIVGMQVGMESASKSCRPCTHHAGGMEPQIVSRPSGCWGYPEALFSV